MADTEKGNVWMSVLVPKDLVADLDEVARELDTDRSKLIRQLARDAVAAHRQSRKIKDRTQKVAQS